MSTTATPFAAGVSPVQRLEVLFGEMAELIGQRNAIDGRLVELVAEIERDELCGMTGARSISALVAWKTGVTPHNADTMVAVARRLEEFPRRRYRSTPEPRIVGPATDHTPTHRPTLPRTHRRTRRLVVVPTLPTTTTTNQLGDFPHH